MSRARLACVAALVFVARAGAQDEGVASIDGAARATVLVRALAAGGASEQGEKAWGAGFFVTPEGHALTTCAVVTCRGSRGEVAGGGGPSGRVQVVWAGPRGAGRGRSAEASVVATSPELDLALLSVPVGDESPYVRLGDSDALEPGQAVTGFGLPEVRPSRDPAAVGRVVPPSGSPGRVRSPGDAAEGGRQRIGTDLGPDASVSGGPLVDSDGYAVGMMRGGSGDAASSGEAIPSRVLRGFLEASGLGGFLPPVVTLGAPESAEGKGFRLRVAGGLSDAWPGRTRWESAPGADGLSLRIDRCLSPLDLAEIEERLLTGTELGGVPAARAASAPPTPRSQGRVRGAARGAGEGAGSALEYVLLNLGKEKVVARYAGPADLVAANRGVLRQSLETLEASQLLMLEVRALVTAGFEPARLGGEDGPIVRLPAGWTREGEVEGAPAGLPPPDGAVSASPSQDYTVATRVFWWRSAPAPPEAAAAAVSPARGAQGASSYATLENTLGVPWLRAGRFLPMGGGLLLVELRAPREKADFLETLYEQWLAGVLR